MSKNKLFALFAASRTITDSESNTIRFSQLTGVFIMGFAFIYGVLPSLWYESVLPDSAQNISWGHTWAWSYSIHPPLGTWLVHFMNLIFANNETATFSSSVLCLSVSLLFIYKLSKKYMGAKNALVACILSSLSLYYMINFALQYNQNIIMLPFWVMIGYYFDRCLADNRTQDWIFLALVTTASLLAKYESMIIIVVALFYLFRHFDSKYMPKLLLAFVLSLVLLLPHLISVAKHGFLTIECIQSRMHEAQNHSFLYKHIYYPFKSFFEQICHILPGILLLLFFIKKKKITSEPGDLKKHRFNYMVYLGIAPLCLVILISGILGVKIHAEWGYPLLSFTLPAIMSYYQLDSRPLSLLSIMYIALGIHLGSLMLYAGVQYFSSKETRTNYPSYVLAKQVTEYWQKFTKKPIRFVGSEGEYGFYLSAYLPTKPLLLEKHSFRKSPWLSEDALKQQGALFVMKGCNEAKNKRLKAQFEAVDYQCKQVLLSNKYHQQFSTVTFMIVLPKA